MSWWWWIPIGLVAWAGLVLLFGSTFGRTSRLGGPLDPRRIRLRQRNIRTVEAEKRKRVLLEGLPGRPPLDPAPDLICYDCLWRGNIGDAAFDMGPDSDSYCPECRGTLDAWDAYSPDPYQGAANG